MKALVSIKTRFGNYHTNKMEFNDEKHLSNWIALSNKKGNKIIGVEPIKE